MPELEELIKDPKLTASEIAELVGCSKSKVYKEASKLGTKFPRKGEYTRPKFLIESDKDILKMRQEGNTLQTIGDKWNISRERVRQICKKNNVVPLVRVNKIDRTKPRVSLICPNCFEEFRVLPSMASKRKYCSRKCNLDNVRLSNNYIDYGSKIFELRKARYSWKAISIVLKEEIPELREIRKYTKIVQFLQKCVKFWGKHNNIDVSEAFSGAHCGMSYCLITTRDI